MLLTEDRTDELKDSWLAEAERRAFEVLQDNQDYQFSLKVGWDREAERIYQNEIDKQYELVRRNYENLLIAHSLRNYLTTRQ